MLALRVRTRNALARACRKLVGDQKGLSAIEYGVLAVFIVAVLAVLYRTLGPQLSNWIQDAFDTIMG